MAVGAPGSSGPETLVVGHGAPTTVLAHGLGGSIAETRPFAGGLAGTRVLYAARGHACSPGTGSVTYDLLGRDLEAVAGEYGATRALGVSMGAAALLSLLAREPDRLERAVLFLPPVLDAPRGPVEGRTALAGALERADRDEVTALVAAEVPPDLRDAAGAYVRARVSRMLGAPQLPTVIRALAGQAAVPSREPLRRVATQVLLLAQEQDIVHPGQVARELAEVLPHTRLVVFDRPGVVFRERHRLRELVVGFLDGPSGRAAA